MTDIRWARPLAPAAAALALAACAGGSQVKPLPYYVSAAGAPPPAGMEEYRQRFVARGESPAWTAEIRVGEARLTPEGGPERILPLTLPYPCFVVGCEGAYLDTHMGRRAVILRKRPCRLPLSGEVFPYEATILFLRDDDRREAFAGCARPAGARRP